MAKPVKTAAKTTPNDKEVVKRVQTKPAKRRVQK